MTLCALCPAVCTRRMSPACSDRCHAVSARKASMQTRCAVHPAVDAQGGSGSPDTSPAGRTAVCWNYLRPTASRLATLDHAVTLSAAVCVPQPGAPGQKAWQPAWRRPWAAQAASVQGAGCSWQAQACWPGLGAGAARAQTWRWGTWGRSAPQPLVLLVAAHRTPLVVAPKRQAVLPTVCCEGLATAVWHLAVWQQAAATLRGNPSRTVDGTRLSVPGRQTSREQLGPTARQPALSWVNPRHPGAAVALLQLRWRKCGRWLQLQATGTQTQSPDTKASPERGCRQQQGRTLDLGCIMACSTLGVRPPPATQP